MKKIEMLFVLTLVAFTGFGQDITLCHTSPTDKFALFASNKNFNKEHPSPRVYVHVSEEGGKMITIKTPDGVDANAYMIEAAKKTNNWIFVFQEWWGLNDNIKRESENLYKDLGNVNILALDMYDGKLATDAQTAGKYMQEFKAERGKAIIKGAIEYVGTSARIGTVGWCFGGGQSMQAELLAGKQLAGCVIYYGMPEDDIEKLKTLNADVLGIFATQDNFINAGVVKIFEENMKIAGKNLILKKYDAVHGFANPSNPKFDRTSTEDAYKNTLEFFSARLRN